MRIEGLLGLILGLSTTGWVSGAKREFVRLVCDVLDQRSLITKNSTCSRVKRAR